MAITAAAIKELRDKTNVGMMECKKALTEADGDMEKAIVILRERGMAVAAKKAGRIAADGLCIPYIAEDGTAVIIEVNCETDFAANGPAFGEFVGTLAKIVADKAPADVDALNACEWPEGGTVADAVQGKILTIGENIKIRRFVRFAPEANVVTLSYNHHNKGKKAVIVRLAVDAGLENNEDVLAFGKNVCMNVCAYTPEFVDQNEIPADRIEAEKAIYKAQLQNDEKNKNKPEAILDKIVLGRISKFYEEVCCVNQPYILDQTINVKTAAQNLSKEVGGNVTIKSFARLECGEGLEKRVDDFADEVARMAGNK